MGNLKYRLDNKKKLLWVYFLFIIAIVGSLIINVLNTKDVVNMYIILVVFGGLILLYSLFYPLFILKHKKPLQLEDNYLAFYVSFNKGNKTLKKWMVVIDLFQLLFICGVSAFYIFKMNLNEIYGFYSLIGLSTLAVFDIYIMVRDIIRIKAFDRIDVHTTGHQFSVIDKKILFALVLIVVALANVGILSVTKPHFVIHFIDMVVFELFSTFLLFFSLISIFITKQYYSHFELKQIEQTEFDTRYLEPAGEGKYAKVFKAYIPSLDTVYAVKKLTSNSVTDIERFKAEFDIMKSLNHPNLLRVYSFDEIRYEYTMDYCKYSLKEYILNNNLTKEQQSALILQMLSAFDYLHKHGILHRDISFFNIMIYESPSYEVSIKVMDFGIAKNLNEEKKTRTSTEKFGFYFDPAQGDFKNYTEQNDIYSLGIMMYFIINKDDAVVLNDTKVSQIIGKCMDCNLANRYHHVSEIIDAFKEASL